MYNLQNNTGLMEQAWKKKHGNLEIQVEKNMVYLGSPEKPNQYDTYLCIIRLSVYLPTYLPILYIKKLLYDYGGWRFCMVGRLKGRRLREESKLQLEAQGCLLGESLFLRKVNLLSSMAFD